MQRVVSHDEAWERSRIAGEAAEREAAVRLVVPAPTTPDRAKAEADIVVAQILKEWEETNSAKPAEEPIVLLGSTGGAADSVADTGVEVHVGTIADHIGLSS